MIEGRDGAPRRSVAGMSRPWSLTRRQAIAAAAPAAAALLAPGPLAELASARRTRPFGRARFSEGVASGDPTPRGITLWTRLHEVEGAGRVTLEVARDRDFRRVVERRDVATSAALGHAVHARVDGLRAHEQYFFRFLTSRSTSPVGRFRTALPADSRQPVRFAFWSCQEYAHGFYNAHEVLADEDLDFVVCLGDYVYAEQYNTAANGLAVREDTVGVARSLQDYRAKYRLYRSDPALRAVHAAFPQITVWDDHEVLDNYAGGERDGGLPADKGFSQRRRAAGYRAFFESQPVVAPKSTDRLYRALRFGRTVELVVMDQRQYRADQPCGDAVAPPCADWDRPRDFLGRRQMAWVKDRLAASPAAWKVLANEVTIMPTKVTGGAYFTFDSWQGYPREREELLTHVRDRGIKDVVFVTGDIHTFIAGDVRTNMGDGETVATEFVGGSITSSSLGETDLDAGGGVVLEGNDANPQTPPALIDTLRSINPWVDQADFDHHGYAKVVADGDSFDCTMVRMETIKRRSTQQLDAAPWTYSVPRGKPSVKGQHGPAS
jgi:alkaline phosphatase D